MNHTPFISIFQDTKENDKEYLSIQNDEKEKYFNIPIEKHCFSLDIQSDQIYKWGWEHFVNDFFPLGSLLSHMLIL